MQIMIKVINGDLFTSDARIIAHQVNCQGKMDSGVAQQVKNKYPNVYDKDIREDYEKMIIRLLISNPVIHTKQNLKFYL